MSKLKKRIIARNKDYLASASRKQTSYSSTSSPMNTSISPQGRLGQFMKNIKSKNIDKFETMSINSTVIQTFTVNEVKENVIQNDLELEEDIADAEFRRNFPQIITKGNKTEGELKLRENLICKIKRV
jgi:hypothetical protein